MESTPSLSDLSPSSHLMREIADDSRQFWVTRNLRLAGAIIAAMLLVQVPVAAAFYRQADSTPRPNPDNAHRIIVSFLGLSSQWAKARFVDHTLPEHEDPGYDIDLRDRFQLAGDVLYAPRRYPASWLLPLFAALAFSGPELDGAARHFWRRVAATVGPLAVIALFLSLAGAFVEQVLAYLFAPAYRPGPYLSDRLRLVPWSVAGESLLINVTWLVPSYLLMPVVAAAARERQPALAACFGTSLFLIPLLAMSALHFYPGGVDSVPSLLMQYITPLITILLFGIALPFALRAYRSNSASTAQQSAQG